jgi:hypothetical protein
MVTVKIPNEAASNAKSAKGPDQGELAKRLVAIQWLGHLLSATFHIHVEHSPHPELLDQCPWC